ncbi:MAG: hypothetical protein JOY60_09515 [Burkholderiaceae bacterium]|nr:hypothetical protein [Burkholderiaceae bacterium]
MKMSRAAKAIVVIAAALIAFAIFAWTRWTANSNFATKITQQHELLITSAGKAYGYKAASSSPTKIATENSHFDFDSEHDIYKFALESIKSKNPAMKYEAYVGARECWGLLINMEQLQNFEAGSTSTSYRGALTPERQLAIREIMKRCDGFIRAGTKSSRDLFNELRLQGEAMHAVEFSKDLYDGGKAPSNEILIATLNSNSKAAIEAALHAVGNRWVSNSFRDEPSEQDLALVAVMLASCNLGKNCTSESFATSYLCVSTGKCGNSLFDHWEEQYTNDEQSKINSYKASFIKLIQDKNYQGLGLSKGG